MPPKKNNRRASSKQASSATQEKELLKEQGERHDSVAEVATKEEQVSAQPTTEQDKQETAQAEVESSSSKSDAEAQSSTENSQEEALPDAAQGDKSQDDTAQDAAQADAAEAKDADTEAKSEAEAQDEAAAKADDTKADADAAKAADAQAEKSSVTASQDSSAKDAPATTPDDEANASSQSAKERLRSVVKEDQEGEMAELDSIYQQAQKAPHPAAGGFPHVKEKKSVAKNEDIPVNEAFKSRVIVITSGKGGVGKTTSAAAISTGLALKGHKTAVIDFDVGLRNLDLVMGVERRVVYDFINVIHGEARLNQALIKDKNTENLFILPASQTKDKESLSYGGVGRVLKELSDDGFEYIICDSPAGIESGALIALYYADEAIVTTNPEVSSVRDSDRIIGILNARSRRAVNNWDPVETKLLLTRYQPSRVEKEEMMSVHDVQGLLNTPLLGVIPESQDVLNASNNGVTIILDQKSTAGQAYHDAVERLLGNDVPMRFITEEKSFWRKLFS